MTKPPHTGTQQPGNHPLPAVSGISSFLPAQVSFFIGLFRLLQPLIVPPSKVRQGRLWLAPDMFLSHISPQGECWLSPVQQGDEHPGRSTPGTGQNRRLLLSGISLQSWGWQQGPQCPVLCAVGTLDHAGALGKCPGSRHPSPPFSCPPPCHEAPQREVAA